MLSYIAICNLKFEADFFFLSLDHNFWLYIHLILGLGDYMEIQHVAKILI